MGKKLTPHSIAKGDENIYFLTPHFKFIKRDRIDDSKLLISNENSIDLFNYHVPNCGKDSFKKIPKNKIHSNYD